MNRLGHIKLHLRNDWTLLCMTVPEVKHASGAGNIPAMLSDSLEKFLVLLLGSPYVLGLCLKCVSASARS